MKEYRVLKPCKDSKNKLKQLKKGDKIKRSDEDGANLIKQGFVEDVK